MPSFRGRRVVVGAISTQQKYSFCFKFELLSGEPSRWLALYQFRVLKKKKKKRDGSWRNAHFCHKCRPCSWRHKQSAKTQNGNPQGRAFATFKRVVFVVVLFCFDKLDHKSTVRLLWVFPSSFFVLPFLSTRPAVFLRLESPLRSQIHRRKQYLGTSSDSIINSASLAQDWIVRCLVFIFFG